MKALRTPAHQKLLRLLKEARKEANFTQTQLARELKRHQSFVAKYEKGERRIEVVEFVQICKTMGASAERIIAKIS